MANEQVAFYMIHARRSNEAFFDLIEDWAGLLVRDGYGVYQKWVKARQTCLAHLIRAARGLAARPQPERAACGAWALVELQRRCQMAKAPPTGGAWRALRFGVQWRKRSLGTASDKGNRWVGASCS